MLGRGAMRYKFPGDMAEPNTYGINIQDYSSMGPIGPFSGDHVSVNVCVYVCAAHEMWVDRRQSSLLAREHLGRV